MKYLLLFILSVAISSAAIAQPKAKLIFREDWKEIEAALPVTQAHVTNSDLKRHANVMIVESPLLDISATFIRNCIRKNQSVRYLVPDPVEEMIRSKKFYL